MSTNSKPYTPYRRTLAWIGFITLYLVLPVLAVLVIQALNTQANEAARRASLLFYEQVAPTITTESNQN